MSEKPFNNKPVEPRRERALTEVPLPQRENVEAAERAVIDDAAVQRLFDGFAYTINRATALLREVEPRAARLSIPVDIDAVQVKAAIRRQRPELSGDQIPFDLYKAMLDKQVEASKKMRFEIVGDLTNDVLTDGYKIKRHFKSGGKGLSRWDEFLMNMEPWLLWLLLNQLIGQHQAAEHSECTAGKQPVGTEQGPIALRYAISVAAMMLIMGMREEHVLFAVQQPQYTLPIPPGDLLQKARRLIENNSLHRELAEIVGAADPQQITAYCDNYISRHPVGFEDWIAYRDLRDLRKDAEVTYIHAHQYSPAHRELLDLSIKTEHRTPTAPSGFFNSLPGGAASRVAVVDPTSVSPLSTEHYQALSGQLALLDRSVGSIAGVLTSGFAMDLLCCFGRLLGKQDVARLRRIRSIIQLSYGVTINGLPSLASGVGVMDYVVAAIRQELVSSIERVFTSAFADVTKWMNSFTNEMLEDLAYCPLLADLFVMIAQAIADLRNRLFATITTYFDSSDLLNTAIYKRWGSVYDARRTATILQILDRLIEAMEVCADLPAGNGGPATNPGEDPMIYAAVPQPLVLPPEIQEKFFRNPNPVAREEGQRPIPAAGTIASSATEVVNLTNFRQFCRGVVPDSVIEAVERGLR